MTEQAHRGISRWIAVITVMLAFLAGPSAAPASSLFDAVSLYQGQGVDENLRNLPGKIVTWGMDWDKTYFTGIGLSKVLGTIGTGTDSVPSAQRDAYRHGYEVLLLKHYGLQSNGEAGAAWTVRTPDLYLGPVGLNFSAGIGLSYALGTPSYEDGPKDDPDRRYRLQLLALFELEWLLRGIDRLSLVTRIHHRSGVFGVIAPQGVGSNFLTLGARYAF